MSAHADRAAAGFADGGRYDRARPDYPRAAVDLLCDALGIVAGVDVLDLAAGTGKLTRHLAARGAAVVAVEPVAGMRDALLRALPGVRVLDGHAEAIPLRDSSVAAVTVAQAFHWFDGPAALAEIARVLAPGGGLGLLWNVMDRGVPWVSELQEHVHRWRGENPWYDGHRWRDAFAASAAFGALSHRSLHNTQLVDDLGLRDRISSISFIATLPAADREEVLAHAERAVARGGARAGDGTIAIPYVTDVFWCRHVA